MGVVVTFLVVFFVKDISVLLGATEEMLPYCVTYARILVAGMTLFMIWEAIIVAEGLAFVMDSFFIFVYRKKYNYQ